MSRILQHAPTASCGCSGECGLNAIEVRFTNYNGASHSTHGESASSQRTTKQAITATGDDDGAVGDAKHRSFCTAARHGAGVEV